MNVMEFKDLQGFVDTALEHPGITFPALFMLLGYVFVRYVVPLYNWRRFKSRKMLKTLQTINPKSERRRMFQTMRGLDPFVFEEMILDAFKARGIRIIRNKRYIGDGGLDGQCVIGKKRVLIQAKRYKDYIKPDHVREFIALCNRWNALGLFVHTGKTGPSSKRLIDEHNHIDMVSGQKLLRLFKGDEIALLGQVL